MDRNTVIATLAQFFVESFEDDAAFVGEWLECGDLSPDEFIEALTREFPSVKWR